MPAVTWAGCWVWRQGEMRVLTLRHYPIKQWLTSRRHSRPLTLTTPHWHLTWVWSPEQTWHIVTNYIYICRAAAPPPAGSTCTGHPLVDSGGLWWARPLSDTSIKTLKIFWVDIHIYFWSCKLIPNNLWGALLRMEKLQNSLYKHTFKMMKVMWKFNRDHFQSPFGAIFQRNNCV